MEQKQKRAFSGMQPTGELHIGNYFSVIRLWRELVKNFECFFCAVDLHAITVPYDISTLRKNTAFVLSAFQVSGCCKSVTNSSDPIVFRQSDVPQHTEMAWILNCFAQYGKLAGMTQFKDKKSKNTENISAGLYTYPILMASDIMLYDADIVPVGEDQLQHVEFAREIANTFNFRCKPVLKLPTAVVNEKAPKIMSLRDATKKMSKSDPIKSGFISICDTPDEISRKIGKATTDSNSFIGDDYTSRPEIRNLMLIMSLALAELNKNENEDNFSLEKMTERFSEYTYSKFKEELTDTLVTCLEPIRTEILFMMKDYESVLREFKKNADRAAVIAEKKIKELKEAAGF